MDHGSRARRPAACVLLGAWAGCAAAPFFGVSAAVLAAAAVFFAACAIFSPKLVPAGVRASITLLAWIALAGSWSVMRTVEVPRASIEAALAGEAGPAEVRGVVRGTPEAIVPPEVLIGSPFDGRSWGFDLAVRGVRAQHGAGVTWRAATGSVRVVVRGDGPVASAPVAGELIRTTGWFEPTDPKMNPGQTDPRWWARADGRAGTLVLSGPGLIDRLGASPAMADRVTAWHERVRDRVARGLGLDPSGIERPTADRALLAALILGEREPELDALAGPVTRLGLAHLLAISGFHLLIAAGAVAWGLRRVADLRGFEDMAVLLAVLAYALLVPAEPPVVRAAIMAIALLAASASGRRYDPVAVTCWAGVVILAWRPIDALSLGAQLSVGVTLALLWIGPAAMRAFRVHAEPVLGVPAWKRPRARWWGVLGRRCAEACVIALVAWLVAMPLVAWRTGLLSIAAVPLAVVGGPIAALLVIGGLFAAVAGLLHVPAGLWIAGRLDSVGGLIRNAGSAIDSFGWTSVHLPTVPWWAALGWLVAAVWWISQAGRSRSGAEPKPCLRRARSLTGVVTLWAVAGACWVAAVSGRVPPAVAVRVDVLAVGDGSCWLVRSGRESMLFDAGSMAPGLGRTVVPRALRSLGSSRVRTAVISHANVDHYNALPEAAGAIGLRRVLISRFTESLAQDDPGGPIGRTLASLRDGGVSVVVIRAGEAFPLGRAVVRVLGPPEGFEPRDENDRSLVLSIEAQTDRGVRRVLLVGDSSDEAVAWLEGDIPDASIMEMPHHGSVRASTAALVRAASPEVLIQSTGPSRVDDQRWDALLARPPERWWVTARDGAVWAEIRRDGAVVSGSLRRAADR